ncbi:MAG TPA: PaaI family thioesterase [Burkholderiaceae bacterium]|nr:PaaI family thioesterase [Burkholderiaceae bacterium]HMX09873.1 PaaI family thioesterase [Burkholderiaceae bacterium]HMY98963.1 PaaI family thioesterase [Burkholderiaceae bacterium]HNB44234.1 PaaI family thioesterase [Burkholderiaceae bacterium]HNG81091.1 PaaI family thioesterase [Burkholderiaceae bacterium]
MPPSDPGSPSAAASRFDVPPGFHPLGGLNGGFIAANGPLFIRREGARVQFGFRVEERHCNIMGQCHGGMMATFCDMLLPLSAHRKSEAVGMRFLPTIGLQIDYLAPVPLGAWVEGEAEVLRVTRSLVFIQGLVNADGVPSVRCSGTFKLGPPFGDDMPSAAPHQLPGARAAGAEPA